MNDNAKIRYLQIANTPFMGRLYIDHKQKGAINLYFSKTSLIFNVLAFKNL